MSMEKNSKKQKTGSVAESGAGEGGPTQGEEEVDCPTGHINKLAPEVPIDQATGHTNQLAPEIPIYQVGLTDYMDRLSPDTGLINNLSPETLVVQVNQMPAEVPVDQGSPSDYMSRLPPEKEFPTAHTHQMLAETLVNQVTGHIDQMPAEVPVDPLDQVGPTDYMSRLPPELLLLILRHLDWWDIIHSVQFVNKTWREMSSDRAIWRDKHLCFHWHTPVSEITMISQVADIHSLELVHRVKSADLVTILGNCPNMKKLTIHDGAGFTSDVFNVAKETFTDLKELSLDCCPGFWLKSENLMRFAEFGRLDRLDIQSFCDIRAVFAQQEFTRICGTLEKTCKILTVDLPSVRYSKSPNQRMVISSSGMLKLN